MTQFSHTKEFHDMRNQFEKDIMKSDIYIGCEITRDTSTVKSVFYENGKLNDLFIAYMLGYANAKNYYQC